jgi:uncharacterized membrane protein
MRLGLRRHVRFYAALACGATTFVIGALAGMPGALLAGGDVFFLVFLGFCAVLIGSQKASDLKRRAKAEDEGIGIVVAILFAAICYFCVAVFDALNRKHGVAAWTLALAALGAPLGWLVLHTSMAFHYADLHYFKDPESPREPDLDFPGRGDAGPWDFLYFSFVIGMTCQVSDVAVRTTTMRRTVLWHGIVSFFFNTVFIALAVNAGVAMAAA